MSAREVRLRGARRTRALAAAAAVAAVVVSWASAPAALAARPASVACRPISAQVTAGRSVQVAFDCAVASRRGGVRWIVRGTSATVRRAITAAPRHGALRRFGARRGTARYVPRAGFAGSDVVRYRVTRPGGGRFAGTLRIRVVPRKTAPPPAPPSEPPGGDGLPALLPPAQPAYTAGVWAPTAADTCPASVHERFAAIGPDGKRYPTWHPPTVVNPATGAVCGFGHEHGRDPRGSDIHDWTLAHLARPGAEAFAGIPFGLATEALDVYAAANPGTRVRHEDHFGYKLEFENDVRLLGEDGADLGVTCDYLILFHQGTHSADATANNVHEVLYAARCDDGTELIADTIATFGAPGEYTRSCEPGTTVPTIDNGYPAGPGARSIPDRTCATTTFLVPTGRTTSTWALYENWSASTVLRDADGDALASYDSAFGVFNPSRYADPGTAARMGRSLDLCWEVEPNGDRARGVACSDATAGGTIAAPYPFNDVRSPFDGTRRDLSLADAQLRNQGGPRIWWTDPYGRQGSPTPFPGAVCQLVAAVDTSARPAAQTRVFGRNRPYDAEGVHAPN